MNALCYIIVKSIVNSIKELPKKPGRLVLYLLAVGGIVGMVVMSFYLRPAVADQAPMFWFTGILFLFISLFFVMSVLKGTSNGDNIFDMNDVNLLFVSPVSSRKILLYGIVKLVKVSFLAGFFILFQSNSLANFGIRFDGVLITLAGFMLCMVVLSVVSLLVYSLTNGNNKRKTAAKLITAALYLPLAVYLAVQMLQSATPQDALQAAVTSPFLTYIPIVGWTTAGVTAFLTGGWVAGLLFFGADLLVGAALVAFILKNNPDYYEDTLVAAETIFERKRAIAAGSVDVQSTNGKPVRVLSSGISGRGASSVFYKHMRESFRQNRLGFFSPMSLLIIAGAIIFISVSKNAIIGLQILMWMQIMLIGTGRGLKETYTHYIYLIPEPSFKKILWSNMEIMLKCLIESVLIFCASGIVLNNGFLIPLGCAAVYFMFSFMLIGINYLSMRFFGSNISMGVLILIYYLSVVVVIAPGLIPALIVGFTVAGEVGSVLALLILAIWELAAGLICFALSAGVLHNCDMPSVRPKK